MLENATLPRFFPENRTVFSRPFVFPRASKRQPKFFFPTFRACEYLLGSTERIDNFATGLGCGLLSSRNPKELGAARLIVAHTHRYFQCVQNETHRRPTFFNIEDSLSDCVGEGPIYLAQVAPCPNWAKKHTEEGLSRSAGLLFSIRIRYRPTLWAICAFHVFWRLADDVIIKLIRYMIFGFTTLSSRCHRFHQIFSVSQNCRRLHKVVDDAWMLSSIGRVIIRGGVVGRQEYIGMRTWMSR